jgi:hypothetical protein
MVGLAGSLALLAACVGDDPAPTADTADAAKAPTQDSSAVPTGPAETGAPIPDAGEDAADSAPKRFCQTQSPLTGVADFFCADFDGTTMSEGFTTASVPDAGGALTRTTDIFSSAPASVVFAGGATLQWSKTAGTAFAEVDVEFALNVGTLGGVVAPQTGNTKLVELSSIDTNLSIRYTSGGSVEGTTYTGYYLETSSCPNACALSQKKISTALPLNVWTIVQVSWTKTGVVKLSFNGVDVTPVGFSGFASTSTKVSTTLGLASVGAPPGMARHAFDNFIVSVKRN